MNCSNPHLTWWSHMSFKLQSPSTWSILNKTCY